MGGFHLIHFPEKENTHFSPPQTTNDSKLLQSSHSSSSSSVRTIDFREEGEDKEERKKNFGFRLHGRRKRFIVFVVISDGRLERRQHDEIETAALMVCVVLLPINTT